MAGKWVRCPHCKVGRALEFRICTGNQLERCPSCGGRLVLVIEGWKFVEVRPLFGP